MPTLPAQSFKLRDGRQVQLRTLAAADAVNFPPFAKQIALESTHTLRYQGQVIDQERVAKRWGDSETDDNILNLAAFDQGKMIGLLHFYKIMPDHPWKKHVGYFGMMILDAYGGQGLGTRLLEFLDEFAKKIEITRIEATVRVANQRALKLYQKMGYQIEGTLVGAAKIDGVLVDEYTIAKNR